MCHVAAIAGATYVRAGALARVARRGLAILSSSPRSNECMADEPKSFYTELRQRKVIRVAAAYIVGAWVTLQFFDLVLENIEAPRWIMLLVMAVLAIGFPLALVLAWAFDITPAGIRAVPARSRAFTLLVVGVSLAVLGWLGWALYDTAIRAGEETPAAEVGRIESIAVLPFENLSSVADDVYFADGLADTLLHKLAQLRSLKVIARNSSFQFRGTNRDTREIGDVLDVDALLEGTVQRQGGQVRIIAQLIDTSDGSHIWSGTFDDAFENIFELQDRVASAIMEQLQISISDLDRRRVLRNGTDSVEAYDMLMRATRLPMDLAQRPFDPATDDVLLLIDRALALDPEYAQAWTARAERYTDALFVDADTARFDEYLAAAREAAQTAIDADPTYSGGYRAMGSTYRREQNNARAKEYLLQAIERDPGDTLALSGLGLVELTDDPELAYGIFSRIRELDPQSEFVYRHLFYALARLGRLEEAVAVLEDGTARHPNSTLLLADLAGVYGDGLGRPVDAARWGARIVESDPRSAVGPLVMASVWLNAGDAERADAWLDHVEENFPGLPQVVERRAALRNIAGDPAAARAGVEAVPESPNFMLDRATAIAGACLLQGDARCLSDQAETMERWLGRLEEMAARNVAAYRYAVCIAVLRNAALAPEQRDGAQLGALAAETGSWSLIAGNSLRYTRYLRAMVLSLAGDDAGAVQELAATLELPGDGYLADDIFGLPPDINPVLTRLAGTPGYRDWLQVFRGRREGALGTLRDMESRGEIPDVSAAAH